ncbi:MAG: hypothetical protein M3381_00215 [Actinomycetota bacterium]|nr:hypothetical protein [Actinomycetota bacterium]
MAEGEQGQNALTPSGQRVTQPSGTLRVVDGDVATGDSRPQRLDTQ